MKILIDGRGIQDGFKQHKQRGLGHYVLVLLERLLMLQRDDLSLDFLFDKSLPIDSLKIEESHRILHNPSPILKKLIRSYESYFSLGKTIRRLNYDLIHFLSYEDAIATPTVQYAVTMHDIMGIVNTKNDSLIKHLKHRLKKAFSDKIIYQAAGIVTISEHTKKDVLNYYNIDPEKIRVIYSGVHERFFCNPTKEEIKQVLDKYKLSTEYLLYVGGIDPRKNILNLLKSIKYLNTNASIKIPLALVGKLSNQSEYDKLQRLIKQLKIRNLIFEPGYIEENDLPLVYTGAQAFIFPSFYEGFGLPVLQAMAAGTPVITTELSSIPEIAGNAVIYVDPEKPESIASGIEQVLTDGSLRDSLITKGKIQAEKFSWESTITNLLSFYRDLISNSL